ncbi:esterase FE4 isoform X3 [Folsomia candida]|uniref:esterase FE4 isoform X3 n=1 Tax=Folsomia candida TaxID=158441 RepID=UPI001604F60E|nr:esterase FE4 isoform X3 [Folsomia candida]
MVEIKINFTSRFFWFYCAINFAIASENGSPPPIVKISDGKLSGKVLTSRSGNEYYAFLGVPFGKAKRFEVATNPEPWVDIYNATEFGAECMQFDLIGKTVVGDEDCLFLNVYTTHPQFEEKSSKTSETFHPVMVWLHGGGFSFGSSNIYSANYFMDEPVVLVTLNYRLGAFGFLDTQDGVVPGNLGLRDQRLALEWVHKNIAMFGGDSSRVTFFGSSAGAASVALHMLTETSALFHRGISESSTALSSWLIQRNPRKNAQNLARFLNCSTQPSHELVSCLKSKSGSDIVDAMSLFKLGSTVSDANFLFTPSIENSPDSEQPYLKKCPEELIANAKFLHSIPWMVGCNKNDGILNVGSILETRSSTINEIIANWTEISPWLFVYNYDIDGGKDAMDEISFKIKGRLLSSDGQIDEDHFLTSLPILVGDRWEVSGTVKSIQKLRGKIPMFPFIFSYFGNFSYTNKFFGLKRRHGVGHLDELQYLFDGVYGAPSYNDENKNEETKFSQELVKLWQNTIYKQFQRLEPCCI